MVEIVVGINLVGSGLYGGDRGEICNFPKLKRCVCWFLRENASENQIKSLKIQVLAKMKRETDIDIDIVVGIMVEIVVGINLIRSGLYGEDRCEIYFIILKLIKSIFKLLGKYKKILWI